MALKTDGCMDALREAVDAAHIIVPMLAGSSGGSSEAAFPLGIVAPRDAGEVIAALEVCRRFDAPVQVAADGPPRRLRGAAGCVVFDLAVRMNRIWSVDAQARRARVDAGCSIASLNSSAAKRGLIFPPSQLAPLDDVTVGGAILGELRGAAANAVGSMAAFVEELDIVTYDGTRFTVGPTSDDAFKRAVAEGGRRGEIYAAVRAFRQHHEDVLQEHFYPDVRRLWGCALGSLVPENGGNIAHAFVGSEGTLGIVLEARVALIEAPKARAFVAFDFPDVATAADNVPFINAGDPLTIDAEAPPGRVAIGFGAADQHAAGENADALIEMFRRHADPPAMGIVERGELAPVAARDGDDGTTCVHVMGPLDMLGSIVRDIEKTLGTYGYTGTIAGHFAAGNVACRIAFAEGGPDGAERLRMFCNKMAMLASRRHGTISLETPGTSEEAFPYGDDQLEATAAYRQIWDPERKIVSSAVRSSEFRTAPRRPRFGGWSPPLAAAAIATLAAGVAFVRVRRRR